MADQYFTEQPTSASAPTSFQFDLHDRTLELVTDAGVFSRGRLDKGTRVLLDHAPVVSAAAGEWPGPAGPSDLLDLGCGYGPIALSLADRRRRSTVWAVDVNDRALDLTRRNAEAAGLANVRTCRPEEVPGDVRFVGMWSNPPIRSGKAALHELLLQWLPRIDGPSYLVVARNLGSDSLARWLGERGYSVSRLSSNAGFRVLAVEGAA